MGGTARLCATSPAEGASPATDRTMHGAQRKHIFFAGVPKRIGHMSMHDQSATLTVAFSLLAASRCLEEQETDGARGDPPAGGRESCTIRACCARLGACAPLCLSEPPAFGLRKLELSWVLGWRSQVQFSVADGPTRAPPLVPKCAGHFLRCLCLLLPPGSGSCGQQRQRRPSESMQLRVAFVACAGGNTGRRHARIVALRLCS